MTPRIEAAKAAAKEREDAALAKFWREALMAAQKARNDGVPVEIGRMLGCAIVALPPGYEECP